MGLPDMYYVHKEIYIFFHLALVPAHEKLNTHVPGLVTWQVLCHMGTTLQILVYNNLKFR